MRTTHYPLILIPILLLAAAGCGEVDTSPVTIEHSRVMADHDQRLGATNQERFGAPPSATPAQVAPAGDAETGFRYQLPEGWSEAPPAPMRVVNLQVPGGAECYVSITRGGAPAVRRNLDRWLVDQLGQPPISDQAFAALPRHPMLGGEALLLEAEGSFRGMGAAEATTGYAIHGLIIPRGDEVITVKLVGPAAVVAEQHAAMLAFAASLEVDR